MMNKRSTLLILGLVLLGGCSLHQGAESTSVVAQMQFPESRELYRQWSLHDSPPDLLRQTQGVRPDLQVASPLRQYQMALPTLPMPVKHPDQMRMANVEFNEDELQFGYEIPVVLNDEVQRYIDWYTGPSNRRGFERKLELAHYYRPMIEEIFAETGVPPEIAYLALVESGYQPRARSHASAVGIWQFIRATGERYGLEVSWWMDQRRDPLASTRAAARYLSDLHARFGDWYLAMAAYNCGEGRVQREIRRSGSRNFWKLQGLPRESRSYVPAFLATLIISRDPQQFGLSVDIPEERYRPDVLPISTPTSLSVISRQTGISIERLRELNPELNGYVTPPSTNYGFKLPGGKAEPLRMALQQIPGTERVTWIRHRVERGESLYALSRKYKTTIAEIRRVNQIRGSILQIGQMVLIPSLKPQRSNLPLISAQAKRKPEPEQIHYRVRQGDSLYRIARRFDTSVDALKRTNDIHRYIYPGQMIRIQ